MGPGRFDNNNNDALCRYCQLDAPVGNPSMTWTSRSRSSCNHLGAAEADSGQQGDHAWFVYLRHQAIVYLKLQQEMISARGRR